jgi:superfamily II DNA or RNA helicase/HKD family nuclease
MSTDDLILPHGAYETPVTKRILQRIEATTEHSPTTAFATSSSKDPSARERYIQAVSRTLAERLAHRLEDTKNESDRLALINGISDLLDHDDAILEESLLYAVHSTALASPPPLPEVSLTGSSLLTNARNEPNLSSELSREIRTADEVDLLIAFIKRSGISVLHDHLLELKNRNIPFRVITSTYCGATEAAAVKRLATEYGAQVKIGYESKNTRLHAKAWLFRRNSGFDTAYVGSSNLSTSALVDGLEWNVRTSTAATPAVIAKFTATFDTYWNDPHFASYDPDVDDKRLNTALTRASTTFESVIELSGLRIEPYPYQQAMLEALSAEREVHDRHRNLLVAATGTGKTVVAAMDYRNLKEQSGKLPRLLFIAHRKEILRQALRTYREVLRLPSFGELLVDGQVPSEWNHVFASIQSLTQDRLQELPSDHFEVVVIDEFHHAAAKTYQQVMNHFQPEELLGLTATPERADGINVQKFFNYRTAYELRLWEALRLQLLAPMHYFGINDETDLKSVAWNRSSRDYDSSELSQFYMAAGDRRIRLILSEVEKRLFDLSSMKALGFCVSIDHAEYMAERFRAFGVPSLAVSSWNSREERSEALRALREGEAKVLFSVDIFNEGLDIPNVNTVLLLRPTQSPTIFLQQLGRGLRLASGKDVCTVFDFIGQQHEEFDFEARYYALTGLRGKKLQKAIEDGFPQVPPGTAIVLDRVSQEEVLKNVKRFTRNSMRKIRQLVASEATTDLSTFIRNTSVPLEDIYRSNKISWTTLLRDEKLLPDASEDPETEIMILGRLRSMLHINDPERAQKYVDITSPDGPPLSSMSAKDKAYTRMLVASIWGHMPPQTVPSSMQEAITLLRSFPSIAEELRQLTRYTTSTARRRPSPLKEKFGHGALFVHADYSRAEIFGALRDVEIDQLVHLPREGVRYVDELSLDLFFVTLVKDEDNFSTTTSYKDYPISPELFHWESQSSTAVDSPTAQRYIHHGERDSSILLAVRNTAKSSTGTAQAFTLLGEVDYVRHQSEKPIQFEWKLQRPMPTQLYTQGRAVV